LEITWEACEDAGLIPEKLSGSDTGVYVGGFLPDNMLSVLSPFNRHLINSHSPFGITSTMLSNRISYVFDFKGPSFTIDTACSSSLVTLHLACQGLLNHECSLAICGGVNIMFKPECLIGLCKGQFLSPHCRCMTFDEQAAGYARSEGAGVVILKPLSLALQDKNNIYAIIKATGVNQDGYTSEGIPFPNRKSQEQLIRKVYRQAGISPGDIVYVEAHGTGTQAGDQTESASLDAVLSEGRNPLEKCIVGSVKTNIGHTEAAAGIAGIIKTALCLKHKIIPKNLHFNKPNRLIPFEQMCIRIPTQRETLPDDKTLYAGVNAFGYGGTNAHVLMETRS
jgi:acyl transferase domain-containing protein